MSDQSPSDELRAKAEELKEAIDAAKEREKTTGSKPPVIFLACPTYNHQRHDASSQAIEWATHRNHVIVCRGTLSLLAHSFNLMWVEAHERRRVRGDVTHFCMLHADIAPLEPDWLDVLLAEMQTHKLDAMCAVSPMKEKGGHMTSAGKMRTVGGVQVAEKFSQARLGDLPATFTREACCEADEYLLLNTGCFLVDIRGEWCDPTKVFFTIRDWVSRCEDGSLFASVESEDYYFSRCANEQGARLGITSRVPLKHWGSFAYSTEKLAESHKERTGNDT